MHAGWLAHGTEAEHQRALRDEARTQHLQTRADYQPSRAEHKKRQRELRDQILQRSGPKASRSAVQKAAEAVKSDVRAGSGDLNYHYDPPPERRKKATAADWDDPLPGEALPYAGATHILTARSKSGKTLNPLNGEPEDSIAVYGQEDLDRRLAAAAKDPDIEVSTRPVTPELPEADPEIGPDASRNPEPVDNEWPTGRRREDQHGPRAAARNGTTPTQGQSGTNGEPVTGDDEPPASGWSPEEDGDTYAVHPDGTTRKVPPDKPSAEPRTAPDCGCVGRHADGCHNGPPSADGGPAARPIAH